MRIVPIELRRRIVEAYEQGLSGSYEETAELFGVGPATVSRLLRRHRAGKDLRPQLSTRGRKRRIDLQWLEEHAKANPDARLCDRVEAWEQASGVLVHVSTMGAAMKSIGWTHKKRLRLRTNESAPMWSPNGRRS